MLQVIGALNMILFGVMHIVLVSSSEWDDNCENLSLIPIYSCSCREKAYQHDSVCCCT